MKHFIFATLLCGMPLALGQVAPQEEKPVIDRVTIPLTDSIAFTIPITSPTWEQYKSALPPLALDPAQWGALAQSISRTDLEIRLHDELAAAYLRRAAENRKFEAPILSEMVQAEYLARKPDATPAQKKAYHDLCLKDGPILDERGRPLMAIKLLLIAMQNDIHIAPAFSSDASGHISPKTPPAAPPR